MHGDDIRRARCQRDGGEVLQRVVGNLAQEWTEGEASHAAVYQRVPIGRGFRDEIGSDTPAAAGTILDQPLLSHR